MHCKNCNEILEDEALFCDHCGAKVIRNRITLKLLLKELFSSFGWDSLYFTTLKKMLSKPQVVLIEYLEGARKKYVNPFAYLAVGAALSVLVYNFFSEDYMRVNQSINEEGNKQLVELANTDLSKLKNISKVELLKLKKEQEAARLTLKLNETIFTFMLKYFNLISFLYLPLYALLSKWTFRRPHNYGEHIIMNAYLFGTLMYFTIILFLLSIVIHPKIFFIGAMGSILYYLVVFGKMYNLSFKGHVLKLLRFLLMLLLLFLLIVITVAVVMIIGAILGYKLNVLG